MEELKCPVCKKVAGDFQILPVFCGRCGCDLSFLARLRVQASQLRDRGTQLLQDRCYPEAYSNAVASWKLVHSSVTARLAFMASLGLGNFGLARNWYYRVGSKPDQSF